MSNRTVIALGADIKNRFLLAQGASFYFGPQINDLSQAGNFAFFKQQVRRSLKKAKPGVIVCDLHPNYFSSLFAHKLRLQLRAQKFVRVQHHHAHIASVMQEHGLKKPVIGVCFDGTGYGEDGNFWGGEFLQVSRSGFRRLAHLKYRKMPGGDKVVLEPWRMALSILGNGAQGFLAGAKPKDQELILTMLSKDINSPLTSSAGRLFDAAAALLGICLYAATEAQGPIKLEALCVEQIDKYYQFKVLKQNGCSIIDTDGLFLGMLKDLKQGKNKRLIATKFHNSMAAIIIQTTQRLSRSLRIKDVALSGGVFQNQFLNKMVIERLSELGFRVFTNTKTPVNDLNICLGQYYVSGSAGKS